MEKNLADQREEEFFEEDNPQLIVTPERARTILQKHGLAVSQEQAAAVLTFLRRLALTFLASTKYR
jgi:hypothetical protein